VVEVERRTKKPKASLDSSNPCARLTFPSRIDLKPRKIAFFGFEPKTRRVDQAFFRPFFHEACRFQQSRFEERNEIGFRFEYAHLR